MGTEKFKQQIQEAERLLEYFRNKYAGKYKRTPLYNAQDDKYKFLAIIDHIGFNRAKEAMDYMFKVNRNPEVRWFVAHYHELVEAKEQADIERDRVARLRARTKKMVEGTDG